MTEEVRKILQSCKVSTHRDNKGKLIVKDSVTFKGMPLDKLNTVTTILDSVSRQQHEAHGESFITLDEYKKKAEQKAKQTVTMLKQGKVADSIFNEITGAGSSRDPYNYTEQQMNLWISPYQAASLYSQKGIPEIIINKKSKSIMLNGIKIKNSKLSEKLLDKISEKLVMKDLPMLLSDATRDALCFGGSLVFPFFKKDTPITFALPIQTLLKTGIIGKDCISHIVTLDRWNVMMTPPVNPTQKDFLNPDSYFIPYLGADLNGQRCSRIVTAKQAGWWGAIANYGWGISDFCGYMKQVLNYDAVMQTIPLMIQQMSILARQINVEGILAQEGLNALDDLANENSVRLREWSPHNPITMDLLGNLVSINRDFKEVPTLVRLIRQDVAAHATIPEPMIWSSEKGNFSSGDDTEGNLAKQYEAVKYIHKDVETQFKRLAMILIIDALGTSKEVMDALPYTQIHFDTPIIANSVERAEIAKSLSQSFFNFVGARMPSDIAARLVSNFAGDQMSISSEVLDELKEIQKKSDEMAQIKFNSEIEAMQNQESEGESKPKQIGEKEGYSKLEQKQHERTRLGLEKRDEKLVKRQNKLSNATPEKGDTKENE